MGAEAHFPARLRELRERAGLTQQQLAEASGMTREGIAQLETGRRGPSWATVLSLAEALGVDCLAFVQEPADTAPRGPGRPAKSPGPEQDVRTTGKGGARSGRG